MAVTQGPSSPPPRPPRLLPSLLRAEPRAVRPLEAGLRVRRAGGSGWKGPLSKALLVGLGNV